MRIFKCPMCDFYFEAEDAFKKHFNEHFEDAIGDAIECEEDDFDKELAMQEMEDIADRFQSLIQEIDEFNNQNRDYGYGFDIAIDDTDEKTNRVIFTLVQPEDEDEDECDGDCDDCDKTCDSLDDDFESFLKKSIGDFFNNQKTVSNVDISDAADYFVSSPLAHIDIMQSIFDEDKFFNSVREVILKYAETKGLKNLSEEEELRFVARIMAELGKNKD